MIASREPRSPKELIPKQLLQRLEEAEKVVRPIRTGLWVLTHYDGDGLAAGGIVARALLRDRVGFQTRVLRSIEPKRIDEIARTAPKGVILCDLGSSVLDKLEDLGVPVIVLDHHRPVRDSKRVVHVNAHICGIDGTYECCASMLALCFALVMDSSNWSCFPYALAGVISDRQDTGGLKGLNRDIVAEGVFRGLVSAERGFDMFDGALGGLADCYEPYIRGISGNPAAARRMLDELGLDPEKGPESLAPDKRRLLASVIVSRLLRQNVRPEFVEGLIHERFRLPGDGMYCKDLADAINACGREGMEGLGIAVCLGDAKALDEARKLSRAYDRMMLEGLRQLEGAPPTRMKAIQHFRCPSPSYGGPLAGVGLNFIFDPEMPAFAITELEDSVKVSTRGTAYLVSRGLDLAETCRNAAAESNGTGGGHPVAAGATVPRNQIEKFLALADDLVAGQLSGKEK